MLSKFKEKFNLVFSVQKRHDATHKTTNFIHFRPFHVIAVQLSNIFGGTNLQRSTTFTLSPSSSLEKSKVYHLKKNSFSLCHTFRVQLMYVCFHEHENPQKNA